MIVCLRGTATETIKNIVLAGIGKLIVADDADVSEEDLGAGFFFQEEDLGKKVLVNSLRCVVDYKRNLQVLAAIYRINNDAPNFIFSHWIAD